MQKRFATLVLILAFAVLPQSLGALTQPSRGNQIPAFTSQSQVFVSSTTSLVRDGDRHACVQSAGTDWKTDSTAITALGRTPVDLRTLQSNSPFVSLVTLENQDDFLRIALGFRITETTPLFEISDDKLANIEYQIEPRGDTIVVSAADSLERVLAALRSDDGLRVTAQSQKQVPSSNEHIVSHLFKLDRDDAGLNDCQELALKPAREPIGDVQISLGAMAREDADIAHAQAAACNRDLDPTNAELVAISTLDGIALPLSHALVRRDENGTIAAIWAGDLLRIERTGSTYQRRISNSIRGQGPLGSQNVAACTRMAAPTCASVFENNQGRITVTSCLTDLVALAARPSTSPQPDGLNPVSPISFGASSGGGFGGGGGGGTSTTSTPATSSLPPSDDDLVEYVLATIDPERTRREEEGGTPEPPLSNAPPDTNVVPLPGGLGLIVFAMGIAYGASRRKSSSA